MKKTFICSICGRARLVRANRAIKKRCVWKSCRKLVAGINRPDELSSDKDKRN